MLVNRIAILIFLAGVGLWVYVFATSPSEDSATVSVKQTAAVQEVSDTVSDIKEKEPCVNINTATASELETLPGIGPVIARRIVAYRNDNGPFSQLPEVDRVKGIGPAKLKKIAELICFK